MEQIFARPFLMVTTRKDGERSFPYELKDNQPIHVVKVLLSNPYQPGEKTLGRCKYKVVHATTDKGIQFLLWDDEKEIYNARQYGSSIHDPAFWGQQR